MEKNGGKRVLLTSSGDEVSKGIIYHLAKCGFRLVLLGHENCLRAVARTVVESMHGVPPIEVVGLDAEEENEAVFDEAVDRSWELLGAVDAFVHCRVYEGVVQNLMNITEHEFKKMTKINVMAPWFLLRSVSKRMRDFKRGGSIIFLSSINGTERGLYPGSAAYSSCMAAIQQLVKASALEIGKYKIRVNAIARGLHLDDNYPLSVGKERAEKQTKIVMPLKRWLDKTNDLASTVIYLVSDDSRYMTGTTIIVDGGQSIVRPRFRSYM